MTKRILTVTAIGSFLAGLTLGSMAILLAKEGETYQQKLLFCHVQMQRGWYKKLWIDAYCPEPKLQLNAVNPITGKPVQGIIAD